MLPDRVSNPGPPTYESGALPISLLTLKHLKPKLCQTVKLKSNNKFSKTSIFTIFHLSQWKICQSLIHEQLGHSIPSRLF